MAQLTLRVRTAAIVVWALYACVVVPIGTHKGGDIVYELRLAERWLAGLPLYETPPPQGAWWPPFATLTILPLALVARVSLVAAKAAWALLGAGCLLWAALTALRWGWKPVALGFAAVAWPLQNNFEHLNINTVLLGLILAAAVDLSGRRDTRAAVWIGSATALKASPGLLLLYLAYQRRWRACAVGCAVAAGLTYVALLRYGPVGALAMVRDWLVLSAHASSFSGEPMQKLARLGFELGAPPLFGATLAVVCLAAAGCALRRRPATDDTPYEVGVVTLVSVLVAPIGWLHSFTLAFPAWVAALAHHPPGPDPRLWKVALALAGLLTSGMLGHHFYPTSFAFIAGNNDTLGSLLLLALLLLQRLTPAPAPT